MIRRIGILLCVGVLLAALAGAQDLGEKVVTIPTRPEVTASTNVTGDDDVQGVENQLALVISIDNII